SREDFFKTEKTELTVLFVDLRGFTSISSKLSAEQVKEFINIFMGVMIPVAHLWRGTVDKTVGDEIMILFGAPLRYDDHADQAVKTALELMHRHHEVSLQWQSKGLPVLEMGIGVNTGEMVVGNIGCPERVDYTVLGHHVNLAARICSQALGSEILISEFTRSRLSDDLK
ncbi:MAG: adenylate/guanylate cyclase domain-containing protein, partial [Deltaproteobacteria bacterium]|nr:adenylate/guanylate cyclase domain-containing protein [Deltaproteobacteria bacterium]